MAQRDGASALRGLTLASAMALCAGAAFGETLTVASPGVALHFYPFYVAEVAGYFTEEGIELDWVDVGSGAKQIAAVAGGSADVAVVGMQPAISARQNGADVVAVASLFDGYPIQLVLSNAAIEKAGITPGMSIDETVSKLNGLSVAVTGIGSTSDILFRSYLKARGVDPDTAVTIQPLGNPGAMFAAFEQGQVDGFQLGAPHVQMAEMGGLGRAVIDPLDGNIPELKDVPYTAIITNGANVTGKADLMQRTVNALAKAMKLTKDEPEKVQALIKSYFPDVDDATYQAFEPKFRANAALTPVLSEAAYSKLLEWIAITSADPITVTYGDFFVDTFAKAAEPLSGQ